MLLRDLSNLWLFNLHFWLLNHLFWNFLFHLNFLLLLLDILCFTRIFSKNSTLSHWALAFPLFLQIIEFVLQLFRVLSLHESSEKIKSLVNHVIQVLWHLESISVARKWILLFVIENNKDFSGSLAWMSDFQERIGVLNSSLACLTKIEIIKNRTLVSYSFDILLSATVTSYMSVDNFRLSLDLDLLLRCRLLLDYLRLVISLASKRFLQQFGLFHGLWRYLWFDVLYDFWHHLFEFLFD